MTKSLRNNREQWWHGKCKEMRNDVAAVNSRSLYRPIRSTCPWKPDLSEAIKKSDTFGSLPGASARALDKGV